MLDFLSKNYDSPAAEIKDRMRKIGKRAADGYPLKTQLDAAYRVLGRRLKDITPSKARSYWHGAVRSVPSHHMDLARSLTGAANDNVVGLPSRELKFLDAA